MNTQAKIEQVKREIKTNEDLISLGKKVCSDCLLTEDYADLSNVSADLTRYASRISWLSIELRALNDDLEREKLETIV
jgi:hypothetical protein